MEAKGIITMLVLAVFVAHQLSLTSAGRIGVCYGTVADNLPSPQEVINLYKKYGIQMMRIFSPTPEILEALRGTGILLSVGIVNDDLKALSSSQESANSWVATNIVPYKDNVTFGWITAGNEVIPGTLAQYVPGAMTNIYNALVNVSLDQIKVTTVVPASALGATYPPSAGAFKDEVVDVMTQISKFLQSHGAQLMVNVYPYFAYAENSADISLPYAQFAADTPIVDGNLNYYSLYAAMVDSFNAALEKIGTPDVVVAVSESGWPSAGNEPYSSIENAKAYNTNLMSHVLSEGTPRRPNQEYDVFLFAMFNEDLKQPAGVEQNFGLFYPNMEPVYPLF
ncbi:hypothetical protein C5167_000211 [Papaver somniferum]|uniref:Glucan endo-1,3-beta-D-glucosidase n=1 Tax=Papaver somniferum TaxID=3469 RepID=A0A4Y7KW26_PAPSO|nr:probable glucan endo-1,3-beta-glucosidase BG4 [Papaver somniferum]XP_026419018.1 probable glucan endo-1,3-beta-glucosidase BG4 [Papaver somniferum]RZC76114.1 hypothetical protein C5167_000212 [Papaver somniferum]RZC76115.1 hypothetical protein C5167_000211 [Papaver somniferum]